MKRNQRVGTMVLFRAMAVMALVGLAGPGCKSDGNVQEDSAVADADLGLDGAIVPKNEARLDTKPIPDSPPPPNCTGGTGGQPGATLQNMTYGGNKRIFAVHVPASYAGSKCVPLILHFHGWRPAPAEVEDEIKYVWADTANKNTFIAVAPEGLPCPELNPQGEPYLCFKETTDAGFIQELISSLGKQYNIDKRRMYLSGHSGGSFFVQGHALRNPTTYGATVEFSGGCISDSPNYGNSCVVYDGLSKKATRKIPFFTSHNPKDQIVEYAMSVALYDLLTKNGHPTAKYPLKPDDPYDGGKYGHSIDPIIPPMAWKFLAGFAAP